MGNQPKLDGKVKLVYRTLWKCGKVEREIVKFLINREKATVGELIKAMLEKYGPTRGTVAIKAWNSLAKFTEKHAARKRVVEALRRLKKRYIIKID